jgi:hypothetical protein
LRLVQQEGVAEWYRGKNPEGREAKRAVVGVMRKLVLALYQVVVAGTVFEARRLFPGRPQRQGTRPDSGTGARCGRRGNKN